MLTEQLEQDSDYYFENPLSEDIAVLEEEKREAGEFFEEILKILYGKKSFDTDHLEFLLEETAAKLNVKFYSSPLAIGEKNA